MSYEHSSMQYVKLMKILCFTRAYTGPFMFTVILHISTLDVGSIMRSLSFSRSDRVKEVYRLEEMEKIFVRCVLSITEQMGVSCSGV